MSKMFWSHIARTGANLHVFLTKKKVSQHGYECDWYRADVQT